MSMKIDRKLLVGGSAALVGVVLVGGYFYASSIGVEKFEDYLYDNDLSDAIQYRDAAYSPLTDTITLNDVDLDLGVIKGMDAKLKGSLEMLSISGVSDESTIAIRFEGYPMVTNPTPEERHGNILYAFADEPLKLMRQMGVDATQVGGELSYDYDRDDDLLNLGMALDMQNVAGYAINIQMARARKLVDLRLSEIEARTIMDLRRLLEEFGRIEFVSGEARIADHGFMKKLAYLNALSSFRYDKALNRKTPMIDAVAFRNGDVREMKEFDDMLDGDNRKALSAFLSSGGDLNVRVETKRPVRLNDIVKGKKLHRDIKIDLAT